MPIHTLADGELWYDEFGSGQTVVLSSAMSFAPRGYPEILSDPPRDLRLYQIQARGFGRSTHPSTPPEQGWLRQWADDVCAFADGIGVDKFIYTGVSHGAGIGWTLAHHHPDRLQALISVVGTPHDRAGGTESSAGRRRFIENRKNPAVVREILEELAGWTDDPDRLSRREVMFARAIEVAVSRPDDEATINQGKPFPAAQTDEDLAEVLRGIRVPVLIIAGMRDGVISPQSALRAATSVRGARAVLFEDEGHMIAEESPHRIAAQVDLFLADMRDAEARGSRR